MEKETYDSMNFRSFCSYYKMNPIVLYVGAGVSRSNDEKYGLPDWSGLLKEIGEEVTGIKISNLPDNPWKASDEILELIKKDLVNKGWESDDLELEKEAERLIQEELWKRIQSSDNCLTHGIKHSYKFLTKEFLKNATTLRSVTAFCAHPISKSRKNRMFRFGPNRRIVAVISGNYDHYLEAAATSMFKTSILKPVAAFGSLAGALRKIPVYHVHGYVSHPGQVGKDHKPFNKDLVLTRKSYDHAWRENDVFCSTMISQIFLLRHYTTLFIGFSFTDPKIMELLSIIRKEYPEKKQKKRRNYAIVKKGSHHKRQTADLAALGVRPIFVNEYNEIPDLLGKIYEEGLKADYPKGSLELPMNDNQKILPDAEPNQLLCNETWQKLYTCHQCNLGILPG